MLLVGLTGGIGAGKSSVSTLLAERGAVSVYKFRFDGDDYLVWPAWMLPATDDECPDVPTLGLGDESLDEDVRIELPASWCSWLG